MNQLTTCFACVANSTLIFLCIFFFSCQKNNPSGDQLGRVNITISGDEAALPHFEKGLLLLHSFEYRDASDEFLKAQEIDPFMSMAYWGEAMTYNHCLWQEQDYDRGVAALNRLKLLNNQHEISDLEKDFIRSAEILYDPEKPKNIRDEEYAAYLSKMHLKYPSNHEVASFYALALLGSVQEGRDDVIYGKSAVVSKSVIEENPEHPGALHYLIHAYDDPYHAAMALDAADSYSKVAPDASHALHMPSHIFVALGMWDRVVASNEDSYQASLNRMERKKLSNDARGYHAYHWLEYGYLQQGRIDEARKLVEDMMKYVQETPSVRGRKHLIFLKGTFLVETNLWDDSIADIEVEINEINVAVRAQYRFLEGMKAYKRQDGSALEKLIEDIRLDYEEEALLLQETDITICVDLDSESATRTNINESRIMEFQLRALKAWSDENNQEAEAWLKRSTELEDSLSYSYGPPFIQKPTHELYAEWLMTNNRMEEAIHQYDLTLERAVNRKMALEGRRIATDLLNSPRVSHGLKLLDIQDGNNLL